MQRTLSPAPPLPASPTPLLGRERELIDVQVRLLRGDVRLLTLTGVGGSGKTRLALEAARSLAERFADGVCFVDLSSLRHPSQVLPAVARALGIHEWGGQSLSERVLRVLAGRQHLLVLDNFEHLLAAAPQVTELLANCPGLKILATSRAALRVRWEHEVAVWPLALPEAPDLADLETLARVPSVALFIERARSASPDFEFGRDTASAIVEICRRLDGLPLALELAAAGSRLLPPQVLARRLEARLPILSAGPRDLPARQQTMRGCIAWSYELLNPREQRLLRQLAVFAAGGRLDQVEQVCREPEELDLDVLHGLAALVEHSLVRRETLPDGEPRLRMLETIREFALDELEASGQAEAIRRRHALAYVALAEAAEPELFGARRMAWVTRLAADLDNLRTALSWLLDHQAADLSCRLAGALAWWWYPLGRVSTGRDWAERALASAGADACSPPFAKALFTAGALALFVGDDQLARRRLEASASVCEKLRDAAGLARARLYLGIILGPTAPARACVLQEQALAVFRDLGDARWLGVALLACGDRALRAGETRSARALFDESLAVFRQLEDTMLAAEALNKLGDLARSSGEHRHAAALYAESLDLLRRYGGETGIPGLLHNLGYMAQQQGEDRRALDHFSEALRWFRANGDQRGVAECLVGVAGVALALGQPDRAARLLGAADACLQAASAAIASVNLAEYEHNQAAARAQLGPSAFASARQAGRDMSPEQAVTYARAMADHLSATAGRQDCRRADPWLGLLTPRESDVAALLVRGLSNRQIGTQLVITEQTVETHVKHVLGKLGLASRYQVQDWIHRYELTCPPAPATSLPATNTCFGDARAEPRSVRMDRLPNPERK